MLWLVALHRTPFAVPIFIGYSSTLYFDTGISMSHAQPATHQIFIHQQLQV